MFFDNASRAIVIAQSDELRMPAMIAFSLLQEVDARACLHQPTSLSRDSFQHRFSNQEAGDSYDVSKTMPEKSPLPVQLPWKCQAAVEFIS